MDMGEDAAEKLPGTAPPGERRLCSHFPFMKKSAKHHNARQQGQALDLKPSCEVSLGFEPHSVRQPKTKRSQSTEATGVGSCPEVRPLTHQSNCLELHHLQATGKTGSTVELTD